MVVLKVHKAAHHPPHTSITVFMRHVSRVTPHVRALRSDMVMMHRGSSNGSSIMQVSHLSRNPVRSRGTERLLQSLQCARLVGSAPVPSRFLGVVLSPSGAQLLQTGPLLAAHGEEEFKVVRKASVTMVRPYSL